MGKYRKPDHYYIDKYDLATIEELKELEKKEFSELANISSPQEQLQIEIQHSVDLRSFRNIAIERARSRESTIRGWIQNDEHQDRLVAANRLPTGITCNTCNASMQFCLHFFDVDSIPLLFVFECPHDHAPRKIIYPDGREFAFPKPTCKKCGYEIINKYYKENNILYTITTCSMCGTEEKDELNLNIKPKLELVIDEEERRKYCLSFFNTRTFYEDLEALANLSDLIEEGKNKQQLKEFYEVDKIERLNIPTLEKRLQKAIEEAGFIKLSFDRPEMKSWTVVPFNFQDPTDRDEKKSIKKATEYIRKNLITTNWRLIGNLDYRLGYLSGKLKAYERDEDLLKLAKELN